MPTFFNQQGDRVRHRQQWHPLAMYQQPGAADEIYAAQNNITGAYCGQYGLRYRQRLACRECRIHIAQAIGGVNLARKSSLINDKLTIKICERISEMPRDKFTMKNNYLRRCRAKNPNAYEPAASVGAIERRNFEIEVGEEFD